jgi:hypothetical protein
LIPGWIKEEMTHIGSAAREVIRTSRQHVPIAHIYYTSETHGPQREIIAFPFNDDQQKRLALKTVKSRCWELQANLVVLVLEAWMLKVEGSTNEEAVDAARRAGPVRHHPQRVEALVLMAETPYAGWMASAEILPGRRVGPFIFNMTGSEGLFVGLLNRGKM